MAGKEDQVQESISWSLRLIVSLILPLWGIVLIVLGLKDGSLWWIASGVAIGAAGAVTFIGSPLMDVAGEMMARARANSTGPAQARQPRFFTYSWNQLRENLMLSRLAAPIPSRAIAPGSSARALSAA